MILQFVLPKKEKRKKKKRILIN